MTCVLAFAEGVQWASRLASLCCKGGIGGVVYGYVMCWYHPAELSAMQSTLGCVDSAGGVAVGVPVGISLL